MPPTAIMGEVDEGGGSVEITMFGGKTVHDNLLNQLTAKMGKGQDIDGNGYLSFWDAKTSVLVNLGLEGEEVWVTVEKR
jgi:hypothetical protein